MTAEGNCEDIDECYLGVHDCANPGGTCINNEGSFTCPGIRSFITWIPGTRPAVLTCFLGCDEGFHGIDGYNCKDIDECACDNLDNCPEVNKLEIRTINDMEPDLEDFMSKEDILGYYMEVSFKAKTLNYYNL